MRVSKIMTRVTFFLIFVSLVGLFPLAAEEKEESDSSGFIIGVSYNHPFLEEEDSSDALSPHVGSSTTFSAGFRFWEIFVFSGSLYTNVIFGADNIFNIKDVQPLGMGSWGFGMRIPLGRFAFLMDWQQIFCDKDGEALAFFSQSYKMGVGYYLHEGILLEVYTRRYHDFQEDFWGDEASMPSADEISTIGAGLTLEF